MGILSKIGGAVKKVYKKADTVVGGILPGGVPTKPVAPVSLPASNKPVIPANIPKPKLTPAQIASSAAAVKALNIPSPPVNLGAKVMPTSPVAPIPPVPTTMQTNIPPTTVPGTIQPAQVQPQLTAKDITAGNKAFGAAAPLATGMDYATTAFAHPFKMIGAGIDPNKSMADVVNKQFNQPLGAQITDIAVTGASYIALLTGLNAAIAAYSARGTAMAAGTLIEGSVAKAAAGTIIKAEIPVVGEVAVNTATNKLKLSLITKAVQYGSKHPLFVAGVLGTILYSQQYQANPVGDAVQSLNIGISTAIKNGDLDGAREMKEYLDDLTDPGLWRQIETYIPILNVLVGEAEKREGTRLASDTLMKDAENRYMKTVANNAMEQKINAGLASNEEISKYAADNPYSAVAKSWVDAQRYVDVNGNSIFGKVDESGKYVPSPTEVAKEEWEAHQTNVDVNGNSIFGAINKQGIYEPSATELAKRQEASNYYAGVTGGGAGASQWEPPSSLGFGLLHTSGGYEATGAGTSAGGNTYTVTGNVNNDEISMYLFGVPYAQLTDEQKGVIDKW